MAGERAAALTSQLLALSRKQIIDPKVIQANQVLERSQRMLERIIGEDVVLDFALAGDLWHIRADPAQLDQILVNIAVNARDAMPDGGNLTVETRNVVFDETDHPDLAEAGEYVLLAVSDSGHGMDEETLGHVFEPFYSTKKDKGTGLGLSTVYGIVRQNSGTIEVSSEVGAGTTFRIYFPRAEEAAEEVVEASAGAATGMETILLVEDERIVRRLAHRILASHGFTVLEARSGGEALALAEAHEGGVDLLLTDVVMPAMNGRELHERLLEKTPGLKALFMSGYTEEVIAHHGVLDAGTAFLQKPFDIGTLTRRVREALDSR